MVANSVQPNCNCRFNLLNPGARRTPESAGEHHYNPQYLPSASWTYPATNRILIEAGGSANVINQNDTPTGGRLSPRIVHEFSRIGLPGGGTVIRWRILVVVKDISTC